MVTRPIYKIWCIWNRKKRNKYTKSSLHPSIYTLPLTKISYTNPPLTMTTLITKITHPFCHEWQRVRVSSRHLVRAGRASVSILIIIIVVRVIGVLGCLKCLGRRRGRLHKATKASLPSSNMANMSVSRQASMCWSCAMIASKVTPPVEVEEVEVDGAKRVGGAAKLDHLEWNYASLRLTIAASMAHILWKWLETGNGTEKWHKILVITEGKMSLSRVTVSL